MQEDLRANLDAPVSSLTPHAYKSWPDTVGFLEPCKWTKDLIYIFNLTSKAVISVMQDPSNIKHPLRRLCNYCLPLHTTASFLFLCHKSYLKELIEIDSTWAAALPSEANQWTPTSLCLGNATSTQIPVLKQAKSLNFNSFVAVLFLTPPFLMNRKENVPWWPEEGHATPSNFPQYEKSQFWAAPFCVLQFSSVIKYWWNLHVNRLFASYGPICSWC